MYCNGTTLEAFLQLKCMPSSINTIQSLDNTMYNVHSNNISICDSLCGVQYQSDFDHISSPSASRLVGHFQPIKDDPREKSSIFNRISDIIRRSKIPLFAYSSFFPFAAQIEFLFHATLTNISLSILAAFVLTLVLIESFRLAIIMLTMILFVVMNLIALLSLFGISLNSVTIINLSLAISFCIEFSFHFCRSFYLAEGSAVDRVVVSCEEVGGVVFSGILNTKILILMFLLLSSSKIFVQYFFILFLIMLLLCVVFTVFALPIFLAWLGPKSFFSHHSIVEQPTSRVVVVQS